MFFRVNNELLSITLLLFAVSAANAAPTISNEDVLYCSVSRPSDVDTYAVPEVTQSTEYGDSRLAAVAAEFLKPPAAPTDSPAPSSHIKSLPAVPASLLMVLTGFLCVSLVKDRRVWLAALAGLLWVGQAGVQAVPQIALRLSHRNHSPQQPYAELAYPYHVENSNRLRSDIEGTQYIGLLHHLAGIPDSVTSFLRKQESRQIKDEFKVPQFAITWLSSCPVAVVNCVALRAEQSTCFSPLLIFESIPRGPPLLA